MDALITTLLIFALFALLGSGVWIGLALSGVAWIGMELFSSRPAGDAMADDLVLLLRRREVARPDKDELKLIE